MATFHNGKLERGSYFYIAVGSLFLKAMAPEIIEREVTQSLSDFWSSLRQSQMVYVSVKKRRNRSVIKKRPSKLVREQTGRTRYVWTEDVNEAKQFRRRSQANETCRILNHAITQLDQKAQVKLYERKIA